MPENYPARSHRVAYRLIDGTAVTVGGSDAKLRTLNDAGTMVWQLADGTLTISQIADRLCERFEVERPLALKDVEAFVSDLSSKGMVTLSESPAGRGQGDG